MSNIILVGYMGSGKTTIGKMLAKKYQYTFIDTDDQIECIEGRTITDIFAKEGEGSFRNMETEFLKGLISQKCDRLVLSTGGGMVVRSCNQELVKQVGTVVYLQAAPETIYARVKGDKKRPLLQCEDPYSKIQKMMAEREPSYTNAADYVVQVDKKSLSEIVSEIEKIIENNDK